MQKTISATQARIHFGEIMRQAKVGPVIVERDGKAVVVVISKKTYDQLITATTQTDLQKKIDELHNKIRVELAGRSLLDPAEIIRKGREERDDQILSSLR